MDNKKKKVIKWVIGIWLVALVIWGATKATNSPAKLDAFAGCLKERGAVFYGAFWCPHCQNQKTMFGRSARFLPYVECSSADGQRQLSVCVDKDIKGYPTWEFADGSRLDGEVPLQELAEKTGCVLPI